MATPDRPEPNEDYREPDDVMCDECEGSGMDEDGGPCPHCDGTGFELPAETESGRAARLTPDPDPEESADDAEIEADGDVTVYPKPDGEADEEIPETLPFIGELRVATREGESRAGNPKTIHCVESWNGGGWASLAPEFPSAKAAQEVVDHLNAIRAIPPADGSDDDHEDVDVMAFEASGDVVNIQFGEFIPVIYGEVSYPTREEAQEILDEIRGAELLRLEFSDDEEGDDSEESDDDDDDAEASNDDAGESGEIDAEEQPFVSLTLFKRLLDVVEGPQLRTLVRRQKSIGQWIGDGRNKSKEAAFNDMVREFNELNEWILNETTAIKKEAGLDDE